MNYEAVYRTAPATPGLLMKDLNMKRHKAANNVNAAMLGETKVCRDCTEEFSDYWNLMNCRRDTHPDKRRRCRILKVTVPSEILIDFDSGGKMLNHRPQQ